MFSYLEDDNDVIFGADSHYRGPTGGSASFVDGSVSVFDGQGGVKLAGADSEEGRKRKTEDEEPRSILSATPEYWAKILSGTGEALSKGKDGAKDALSQTWDELTGNKELHKGVEFGVKAAGEVSKDVWERVATDAGAPAFGRFRPGAPEKVTIPGLLGTAGGLIWKGVKSYRDFPENTNNLGRRIRDIKRDVYGRE